MDFTLLILFCRLTNARSPVRRIFITAVLGAFLGCLVICINSHNTYINMVLSLIISFVIIYVLYFGIIRLAVKQLLRYIILWYILSFFVYGTAIYIFPGGFDISKMFVTAVILFAASEIVKRMGFIRSIRSADTYIYKVNIHVNGRKLSGFARYDSANMLVEPISGADVIVVCIDKVESFFTDKEREFIKLFPMVPKEWDGITYVRGIPYNTLDGSGIFPGIRADKVDIISGNALVTYYNCYLAVTDKPVSSDGTYDFLLNYKLKGEGFV